MPKPTYTTHFCQACQTEHTLKDNQWPFWASKELDGKAVYWCSKGIDCAGCKKIHPKIGVTKGITDKQTLQTKWLCSKWFKKHGNGQIDFSQYSTQEVLSGVPYGEDRDPSFGPDTEDHSVVHTQQTEALGEALDTLEEQEEAEGRWH